MADRLEQLIEMECADALLDSGVSVPLKRWKLPWLKRPVEGACDDEASEAVGSDSAGEGIPEDGRCARVASKGQGRGTGLCSGTW